MQAQRRQLAPPRLRPGNERVGTPGRQPLRRDGAALTDAVAAPGVHPWSARWCVLLERILAGRAAAVGSAGVRGSAAIVILPSFTLVDPRLDLGRKGHDSDGSLLRFPARVVWSRQGHEIGPVLIVAAGARRRLAWEAIGVGVTASGSTSLRASTETTSALTHQVAARCANAIDVGAPPSVVEAASLTRRAALSELDRLVEDGRQAMWEARQQLERHAQWMLAHRHSAVALEIDPERERRLLDDTDLEVVRTELLLGDPERRVSPAYDRIIERCLAPAAFARVDPERRVMTSLRSVAETAIRRRIADPHVGRKVRQLVREQTFADLEALLAAYRERWPHDAIGVRRLAAAIDVKDVSAPMPSSRLDGLHHVAGGG